ncbi:hypothetical protein F383_38419 [Gossypium arboreum]|uniref:Uncharacterized protein n=1 Tax=Gossypium arboreum TaxID=29729 RepID=A0A0B0MB28_GOSAR|nr:hypothetical protein F383_38419 [Gossypium arboreum]
MLTAKQIEDFNMASLCL